MSDHPTFSDEPLSFSSQHEIDRLCTAFEQQWRKGERPRIEDYLLQVAAPARAALLEKLVASELEHRQEAGEQIGIEEYCQRFPSDRAAVEAGGAVVAHRAVRNPVPASTVDVARDGEADTDSLRPVAAQAERSPIPQTIGRYAIREVLGEGAFGRVLLAYDAELQREVAIKVPHRHRIKTPEDVATYLAEARVLASLDHPHVVPVHDVGRTEDGLCYVVSKRIEGCDLATYVTNRQLSFDDTAQLAAAVADALQHTHNRGLVHRDIKPANILIDVAGRPYVADFGLALRDTDFGKEAGVVGTPAYMSPEQARGEGHLVDGRSDIFGLGVILYELLTGFRPFRADSWTAILRQITSEDPQPPIQVNDSIPGELERICLKALSKRAADRYACAADMAEDLRHWKQSDDRLDVTPTAPKIVPKGLRAFEAKDREFFLELLPGPRDRDGLPETLRFWKTRIEEPAPERTFRVGLLYGPSGCGKSSLVKAGLLPCLAEHVLCAFLEATPDDTEARLLSCVRRVCPDAAPTPGLRDTLATLRRGQGIPAGRKLLIVLDQFEQWLHAHSGRAHTELAAALRQCDGGRLQAILIVRDDFWMPVTEFLRELEVRNVEGHNAAPVALFDERHARKVLLEFGKAYGCLPENLSQLTRHEDAFLDAAVGALAQDGKVIPIRLALFADMLKGKPWTIATLSRVGGAEGLGVIFLEETFSVSTAPAAHRYHQKAARAVLRTLLPETGSDIKGSRQSYAALLDASGYSRRPNEFDDLIQILDGEIRLITPAVLEEAGVHAHAPDGAIEPAVVPVDPTDKKNKYYQLTHDYLVPSLRGWLTRKQQETRAGRAQLRLAERSALWNAKPENQQLPSWWEFLSIRWLTDRKKWTEPQRLMMSRAARLQGIRSALVLAGLLALVSIGVVVRAQIAKQQEATRIEGLVGRLLSAEPSQLSGIATELDANPEVAATLLSVLVSADATTVDEKRAQLHARLVAVSHDSSLIEPLVEELLTGKIGYVLPIRQRLRPAAGRLSERFRSLLRDEGADAQRRLRAALALADDVPESETASWSQQDLEFVAQQLVSSNAEFQPLLREALQPIRARLLGDLERIFGDVSATDAQQLGAANALADYASEDIARLSRLLTVATPEQYAVLYPIVAANPSPAIVEDLGTIAATLPAEELGSVERVLHGQRRANAAATLLRLGERAKALPVFEMTDDPESLTQFVFRCHPRGVSAKALLDCLQLLSDAPRDRYPKNARYALLLALGEFSLQEIPKSHRAALLKQLADWYRHDPSSGVHGATGWLLRQWGQTEVVREVDRTPVPYAPDREWFTLAITVTPTAPPRLKEIPAQENAGPESEPSRSAATPPSKTDQTATPVTSSGPTVPAEKSDLEAPAEPRPPKTFYYTFILFPAGEYKIGSVHDEPDRIMNEVRHSVKLTRSFALLDREITFEELIAFSPDYAEIMPAYGATPADAGFGPDWYDSVAFCRWLGQQSGLLEADQAYRAPESLDKEAYPREFNPAANWAPRDWPVELGRRGFRLPTEAEWEVASRAGARTTYGCGSDTCLLGRFAWVTENSDDHARPPRQLRPSVRGLFDLHGNLIEWTHDWYGEDWNRDYGPDEVTDPLGTPSGSQRVNRGGSLGSDAAGCRSAIRYANDPVDRTRAFGLRLALTPSAVASEAAQGE